MGDRSRSAVSSPTSGGSDRDRSYNGLFRSRVREKGLRRDETTASADRRRFSLIYERQTEKGDDDSTRRSHRASISEVSSSRGKNSLRTKTENVSKSPPPRLRGNSFLRIKKGVNEDGSTSTMTSDEPPKSKGPKSSKMVKPGSRSEKLDDPSRSGSGHRTTKSTKKAPRPSDSGQELLKVASEDVPKSRGQRGAKLPRARGRAMDEGEDGLFSDSPQPRTPSRRKDSFTPRSGHRSFVSSKGQDKADTELTSEQLLLRQRVEDGPNFSFIDSKEPLLPAAPSGSRKTYGGEDDGRRTAYQRRANYDATLEADSEIPGVPSKQTPQFASTRQNSLLEAVRKVISIDGEDTESRGNASLDGTSAAFWSSTRQNSLLDAFGLRRKVRDEEEFETSDDYESRHMITSPRRASLLEMMRRVRAVDSDDFVQPANGRDRSEKESLDSLTVGGHQQSLTAVELALAEDPVKVVGFGAKIGKGGDKRVSSRTMKNALVGVPRFMFSEHGTQDRVQEMYAQIRNAFCRELVDYYSIIKALQERLHQISERHVELLFKFWSFLRRFTLRILHMHETVLAKFVAETGINVQASFRSILDAIFEIEAVKPKFIVEQDECAYECLVAQSDTFSKICLDLITSFEKEIPGIVRNMNGASHDEVANTIRWYLWNNSDTPLVMPLVGKWMESSDDKAMFKSWCEENLASGRKLRYQVWRKNVEWGHFATPKVIWEELRPQQ
mmetsp:Transcript_28729/g.69891  ORF Transcript_28729/g.69891 Transcript_28729/m.69891 type:complete len:726 (-) Transcript_28729:1492-3669(-)|eukprot:CAMPEP_0198330368 /NCGR_PEP_ID=MMETSP1450-20131203/16868_1 /TAXON_ID=753684 ORGANISM="Madagascaria erythrocladiodes, Strain CCMP3234" /NCGR_SAMPLE_ID=MMETSP1450 /ASSEMBLY_ACC=CAM_ASM_001115 /LENGTH=725 /DNA_ID=CAMNT_0044034657 /DNA_START=94 /DNA_END=2271 /DNA_ORIENTATION=-